MPSTSSTCSDLGTGRVAAAAGAPDTAPKPPRGWATTGRWTPSPLFPARHPSGKAIQQREYRTGERGPKLVPNTGVEAQRACSRVIQNVLQIGHTRSCRPIRKQLTHVMRQGGGICPRELQQRTLVGPGVGAQTGWHHVQHGTQRLAIDSTEEIVRVGRARIPQHQRFPPQTTGRFASLHNQTSIVIMQLEVPDHRS